MSIEVTSASRREQRAEDIPAAVYVIGRDEIRRSGLTTIPEVLRLAPGVQVARINSNKWAVSVRGFNSLNSNKLLVMIDGRSIYNPAFSSVLWDTEDLMIEDIDHIEVIRGPGGAMWGANAVNGVINIITRPSSETRGGLARVSSGTFDPGSAAFRYGGSIGAGSYRLFAQGSAFGDSLDAAGTGAQDNWHSITTGFRTDWVQGADSVMVQGSATSGRQRPLWFDYAAPSGPNGPAISALSTDTGTANVQGRWARRRSGGAELQVQGYFDAAHRGEAIGTYTRRTWDIDAQYHTPIGSRHELVAGGGYRHIVESLFGRAGYAFNPDRARPLIANVFAQDAIALANRRVELTVGAKFEDSTFAGSGFQPNARVLWKPTRSQRVWAAVSRALRAPSLIDRGLHLEYPAVGVSPATLGLSSALPTPNAALLSNLPIIVGTTGNPDFSSEYLLNTEGGYRRSFGTVATVDVVTFSGRYDNLASYEPQAPSFAIVNGTPRISILARGENRLEADTLGAEISGRIQFTRDWYMDGAFSTFRLTPHPNGSLDPSLVSFDGKAPSHQWRAHMAVPLFWHGQADVHVFETAALRSLGIDSFTRVDARGEWALTPELSVSASGQNLLQESHVEFGSRGTNVEATRVPRSSSVRLAWRF